MTRVDFHFNAPDKLGHCCRLLRKIHRAGQQAVVHHDSPAVLAELDRLLWVFSDLDFIPHLMADDPLAAETPILLTAGPVDTPHHDVLVNLAGDPPACFSRFERLIEVVTSDEGDRASGRARWRFYRDRGYPIQTYDLAAAG
jgi:DNA polymerase-3 subunit chi